tara:strand:- start:2348 stop:3397 length:1050 start_codon:yes stop_codon:yes gene_type:complete
MEVSNMNNDIKFKDILLKLSEYKSYLYKKKYLIFLFSLFFSALGFAYVFFSEDKYNAELTFVVEVDNGIASSSALSGFASQLGFDFGGIESSTFSNNNILQLLKSRVVVENTLMQSAIVNGKEDLLIEHYLNINELKNDWNENNVLKDFSFHNKNSRVHDSIKGLIWSNIVEDDLVIDLLVDDATIIKMSYNGSNEDFSIKFVNTLIQEMSKMYVQNRTARANNTLNFLQNRADSVARELDLAEQNLARVKDINTRIIKASGRLKEIQLLRDVEVLQAMYIEIIKNLEISKVTLLNQIPIINIIDRPKAPIHKNQKSTKTTVIIAFILGICISIFYFVMRKFIKDVLKE